MPRLPVLLLCTLLPALAHAEIYQWKDEQGRTHFGEVVPEKYRKAAATKTFDPLNVMKSSESTVRPRGGQRSEENPPAQAAPEAVEGQPAAPAFFPPPPAEPQ